MYAIYRCAKLKSVGALRGSVAHNGRHRDTPNADPARTIENKQLYGFGGRVPTPDQFVTEWHKRTEKLARKRDAVLAQELFVGMSPEFVGENPTSSETARRVAAWRDRALTWLKTEFGTDLFSATIHVDETTPHICAYVIPTHTAKDGKVWLSAKRTFNPQTIAKQQDRYAAAVSDLGLQGGIRGSTATHRTLTEYRGKVIAPEPTISRLEVALLNAPPLPPPKGILESASTYRARVEPALQKYADSLLSAARAVEAKAKELDHMKNRIRTLEQTAKARSADAERARASERRAVDQLRDIPLVDVMERFGFGEPVREGADLAWRIDAHAIIARGAKWFDHKQGRGGGGAIDLVMHIRNCEFREAIGWLNSQWSGADVAAAIRAGAQAQQLAAPRKSFTDLQRLFAVPSESASIRAKEYLTTRRHLPKLLVDDIFSRGLVVGGSQSLRGDGERIWCVFPHRDDLGEIRGATLRATDDREDGKRCIGDKRDAFFRFGPPLATATQLALVESPIDALSYSILSPTAHVLSLGGVWVPPKVVAIAESCEIPVNVALDDDEAGRKGWNAFWEALRSLKSTVLSRIARVLPQLPQLTLGAKDWNELLWLKARAESQPQRETGNNAWLPRQGHHRR